LTRWGGIAAIAAIIWGATSASADEASVEGALVKHVKSSVVGISSYYGAEFHGRRTADGEIFDMHALTAASKTLPLPCYARVTNLRNGRSVVVRVNDRGPYVGGRMLDVAERVAKVLRYNGGLERVRLEYLGMAGPAGTDDQRALLASLKTGAETVTVAKAATGDEGVSTAERSAPALGFAEPASQAPAAVALQAAVRPVAPPSPEPLGVAAKLDASVRSLEAALEAAHQTAADAAKGAAQSLSPYGELVISPFKPLVEASR
jgi:rare lipoprotein A